MTVLDNRALNRALLARQLLDRRHTRSAFDTVEHLCGLQAQEPHEPYYGLWSRLDGFEPAELGELLLRESLKRLRPQLRTFRDVRGREL
ncbi:DNA glycosylase AlkZ-like family protein [Paractinoplanes lichenicola]|uniref:DNA glycosylase AlkZ-like family protein n=1 Tax=Paractinoplanes lichenicola TaxID=2802976 RepID=UPI001F3C186F|nr:crosslink repair DNA glycosylase YcaQ family protein [Actinoplanes lichenicola]